MRRLSVIVALLSTSSLACHTPPSADGAASSSAAPVAPASAPPGTTAATTPRATGAATAPSLKGSKVTLTLGSGAELTLPNNAEKREASQENLPQSVKATHVYNLGSNKRLLLVSEFDRGGKTCEQVIDDEIARMKTAKADTDSPRAKFRKVGDIETLTVNGQRVLYADSMNRGLAGVDAGRPAVAMATMIACQNGDHIVLMYTLDQPDLPPGIKATLSDVMASYKAKR